MTGAIRATLVLTGFLVLTLPLMPLQWLLIKTGTKAGRRLPNWYHRQLCRLLGIAIHRHGDVHDYEAVLLVSNHVSWLDIPVLSSIAPLSFVAKKEVANWPLVGHLAKLQRTVFIDRGNRRAVGGASNEMIARLRAGDHVVLFAEGTSSDGNRVLPFMTSLFAAAKPGRSNRPDNSDSENSPALGDGAAAALRRQDASGKIQPPVFVQTVALTYTKLHGLPLTQATRPQIAWYGDMEMTSHAWQLLQMGPIDVHVEVGAPVPLEDFVDRKALARFTEHEIRSCVVRRLRERPGDATVNATVPPKSWTQRDQAKSTAGTSDSWT